MGAVISLLFFLIPLGLFLFNALRVRREQRGPRGISGERVSAKEPKTARGPARKARIRPMESGLNCGRHFTHFLLTVTGSRESCRSCAALDARLPVPIRKADLDEPEEATNDESSAIDGHE
jgi:hypothetical protein